MLLIDDSTHKKQKPDDHGEVEAPSLNWPSVYQIGQVCQEKCVPPRNCGSRFSEATTLHESLSRFSCKCPQDLVNPELGRRCCEPPVPLRMKTRRAADPEAHRGPAHGEEGRQLRHGGRSRDSNPIGARRLTRPTACRVMRRWLGIRRGFIAREASFRVLSPRAFPIPAGGPPGKILPLAPSARCNYLVPTKRRAHP